MATVTTSSTRPTSILIPPLEVFTTGKIASMCGCTIRIVAKWCDHGGLRHSRDPLSGERKVNRDDLIAFLKRAGIETELVPTLKIDWEKIDQVVNCGDPAAVAAPAANVTIKLQPAAVSGVVTNPGEITLSQFFIKEYWPRKTRGNSKGNYKLNLIAIGNFKKFLGRDPTMADFNDDTFAQWLLWYGVRGRAKPTANRDLSAMLALWRYASKRRYVADFPTVELLQEPHRIPEAWTMDQIHALFAAARRAPGMVGDYPSNVWWPALLTMLWWSAERIGAVLQLRWSDVSLETGWVTARAETRKGGRSDAKWPLPLEARMILSHLQRQPDDLIFPWPRSIQSIYDHFKKILKDAGLPSGRRCQFHRIRRSVASHLKAAGGDPTAALGHSSPAITIANYLDPAISGVQGPAALLFSPNAPARKGGAR